MKLKKMNCEMRKWIETFATLTGSRRFNLAENISSDYDYFSKEKFLTDEMKIQLIEKGFKEKPSYNGLTGIRYYHNTFKIDLFFLDEKDYVEIEQTTNLMVSLVFNSNNILVHTLKHKQSRIDMFEFFRGNLIKTE